MKRSLGKLKQSISDYYMGHIKQKLQHLLANGKETDINEQIMQFLDAQMDTGNNFICKDDIIRILNTVLVDENENPYDAELAKTKINYCFPKVADIKIENNSAAYLVEKFESPFNGIEEKSCYLYISPEYYEGNIETIESQIKKLEKSFSRQDFKDFEEKFEKDLGLKQCELESAKVYESASNQIELKKQKFNTVSQKLINDYGKKYKEIMEKDIPANEKKELASKLFDETKSYDEKNRQAVSRLNTEYEKLSQNFQGKVQSAKTINSQMQNLHLFDKNRYFEDMMSSVKPELRDLYRKRYLLNSYRLTNGQTIYEGKQNPVFSFFGNVFKGFKKNNTPLMLGPHFGREIQNTKTADENIDKNLIKSLANFYVTSIGNNNVEFEDYLEEYFKEHYFELTGSNSTEFLSNFAKNFKDDETDNVENGDLFKIAKFFEINPSSFENNLGSNLIIRDGLIYEEKGNDINVIYATDKAINNAVNNLYGSSLYYNHLANENLLNANLAATLQNNFIGYANQNGIDISEVSSYPVLKTKKRFIKKKNKTEKNNVVDFKQESC